MGLAAVRDLHEHRAAATEEELADFETDVLAGFVLASELRNASARNPAPKTCRVNHPAHDRNYSWPWHPAVGLTRDLTEPGADAVPGSF